jgi:hypothetical protein
VLLIFGDPCQHRLLAGQERDWTIPLDSSSVMAGIVALEYDWLG